MSYIQAVLGKVKPSELGMVLGHEHIMSLVPGPWLSGGAGNQTVGITVHALSALKNAGISTVCDLSPYGVVGRDNHGNNAVLLREIASNPGVQGLHIVSGSGTYLDAYSPQWVTEATIDEMRTRFIADATTGIGNSGVIAGIFGEQATGLGDAWTQGERNRLRACGQAARETGLGLKTHTTHGTHALDQIEILKSEGVDLNRVVIGHMDTFNPTIESHYDTIKAVLDSGAHIGIDTIGKETWEFFLAPPPYPRPEGPFQNNFMFRGNNYRGATLQHFIELGYIKQIHLSNASHQ